MQATRIFSLILLEAKVLLIFQGNSRFYIVAHSVEIVQLILDLR